jgi:hypothetical protein
MAAPLSVCTKEEQHSLVQFLWFGGVSTAAIHQRLSAQYGNSVLPQLNVFKWIEKLRNGRTSVMHEEGAGRPPTATNEDNIEHAHGMVLLDYIVLKGRARIDLTLALQPLRSIVLPILDYPFVNPTLLMKPRTFLMGAS